MAELDQPLDYPGTANLLPGFFRSTHLSTEECGEVVALESPSDRSDGTIHNWAEEHMNESLFVIDRE